MADRHTETASPQRHMAGIIGLAALLLFGGGVLSTLTSSMSSKLVFGIVPAVVALVVVGAAIHSMTRRFIVAQIIMGTSAIVLSVTALLTLKRMFVDHAWPTYLPYYAIGVGLVIVAIQQRTTGRET
jgi:hypothetical protein